jgi:ComF family protein
MVVAGVEGVNLQAVERSTIAADAVAGWLRERSPQLPWLTRAGFACLPPRCLLCGGEGDLGAIDLCAACLATLPFEDRPGGVRSAPRAVFAAFTYDDPVGSGLRALKFNGDLRPARALGALLAARVALAGGVPSDPAPVLLPVPLHPGRHAERGFNQAEVIARHVARWLRLEVCRNWLRRTRHTAPQTGLHRAARRRNLADAFAVTAKARASSVQAPSAQARVILLDDVWTTGATLAAARSALRAGGIDVAGAWVVATARRAGVAAADQAARSA